MLNSVDNEKLIALANNETLMAYEFKAKRSADKIKYTTKK